MYVCRSIYTLQGENILSAILLLVLFIAVVLKYLNVRNTTYLVSNLYNSSISLLSYLPIRMHILQYILCSLTVWGFFVSS